MGRGEGRRGGRGGEGQGKTEIGGEGGKGRLGWEEERRGRIGREHVILWE